MCLKTNDYKVSFNMLVKHFDHT